MNRVLKQAINSVEEWDSEEDIETLLKMLEGVFQHGLPEDVSEKICEEMDKLQGWLDRRASYQTN